MSTLVQAADKLRIWEKVDIIVGEDDRAGHYLARIEDFINGGIVITEPELITGDTLLFENAPVHIVVTREEAVYQFASTIKRAMGGAKTGYLLTPPRYIERVQRRMFVRVPLAGPMSWAALGSLGNSAVRTGSIQWHKTSTLDLSGGGVLFNVPEAIEPQTRLLLRIEMFAGIGLPDTIAAVSQRSIICRNELCCGASFLTADQLHVQYTDHELQALPAAIVNFTADAQNRLVSHVFRLQVTMRRKGLL